MHRAALLTATALLTGFAPAQEYRLVERIEAPLVYLAAEPPAPGGTSAVARLVGDPALQGLIGLGGAEDAAAGEPAGSLLRLLRGVLSRAAGEIELALTGILPTPAGAGQPLLVFRAVLSETDAKRMRDLLEEGALGRRSRRLGEHQVFLLGGVSRDAPGGRIEVVVADNDLLVANSGAALDEVLGTGTRPGDARVLARDAGFQELRRRLGAATGSLLAFVDGVRFGPRMARLAEGLTSSVWHWSGLANARRMLAAVESRGDGLVATALFELEGTGNGWLEYVRPTSARTLLAALPPGGMGGAVVAIDPAAVQRAAERQDGGLLQRVLARGCRSVGLDFERQVVRRLGGSGALQLLLLPGDDLRMLPVWSLQARSRSAARDLFADAAGALEERGIGQLLPASRGGVERLRIPALRAGDQQAHLAAFGQSVVLGFHPEVVDRLLAEQKRAGRSAVRAQRNGLVQDALAALDAERRKVAGLLALDLRPVLAQLGHGAAPNENDLGALPTRFAGFLDLEAMAQRHMVRVQLYCHP